MHFFLFASIEKKLFILANILDIVIVFNYRTVIFYHSECGIANRHSIVFRTLVPERNQNTKSNVEKYTEKDNKNKKVNETYRTHT